MDQAHVIRHQVLVEKRPIRAVARKIRLDRDTVKRYLEMPEPKRVEAEPRPGAAVGP